MRKTSPTDRMWVCTFPTCNFKTVQPKHVKEITHDHKGRPKKMKILGE